MTARNHLRLGRRVTIQSDSLQPCHARVLTIRALLLGVYVRAPESALPCDCPLPRGAPSAQTAMLHRGTGTSKKANKGQQQQKTTSLAETRRPGCSAAIRANSPEVQRSLRAPLDMNHPQNARPAVSRVTTLWNDES